MAVAVATNIMGGLIPCLRPSVQYYAYDARKRKSSGASGVSSSRLFSFKSSSHLGDELKHEISTMRTTDRVHHVLNQWEVRGAQRPITDFYEKVQDLGEGAYGAVSKWKVKAAVGSGDSFVAVKLIKWSTVWDGPWRNKKEEENIRTELRMLLLLDHPYIIKFREWYEAPCKGIYFVTELCEGKSVQAILDEVCAMESVDQRQPYMRLFRRFFRELCYAVSYIHGLSPPVLHRDLKPDNLILRKVGDTSSVKLIDFGLATLQQGAKDGEAVGTLPFMAPELFMRTPGSDAVITEEMDVWALGVMFVWFVTAVRQGTMTHPMLKGDVAEGFEPTYYDLYVEYKEASEGARPAWNRDLFDGLPDDFLQVADALLVHDPAKRAKAVDVMQMAWVKAEDPAAASSAALLRHGGVASNLRSYHALGKLHKQILYAMADHVDDSISTQLRSTFEALDTNKSGELSMSELLEGFARMDVDLSEEDVEGLFADLDEDGSQTITISDWLAAALGSHEVAGDKAAAKAAFLQMNSSGTGAITCEDLSKIMGASHAAEINREYGDINYVRFCEIVKEIASTRAED